MSKRNQKCIHCGAIGSIVEDNISGKLVCSNCGTVVQDSVLINEVEFSELSNGNSSRNGQFIVTPSQKSGYPTASQSSVEGKARIQTICESLSRLENQPDVCELAERIFKKALHERFIRGRTIEIVAAACVYVAIRQKKSTGYLLVDVADNVDCGIFELAATALKLSTCVSEIMPVIDPTLFIDRFTDELKFGRLAPEIKETAIQMIRRFDRDWIQTGRKPSGVCGAAIMMAARLHGVEVSKDTILKCARVCHATINKRLNEISKTEFAKSSISEIRENQDIIKEEVNELPPSMKIKKQLEDIANEITKKDKETEATTSSPNFSEIVDTFSDDDLKDVDDMVLDEEESEKRSALFYTMYKSKLNQMPKFEQPLKRKKKEIEHSAGSSIHSDTDTNQDNETKRDYGDNNDDDDVVSDAGDFDDF